jgi:hypothetical protein
VNNNSALLQKITHAFPDISFIASQTFMWSAKKHTIFFDPKRINNSRGIMGLLHEIGHASLKHQNFDLDIDLLNMEVDAWQKAKQLGNHFGIEISPKHIDNCLESYRLWIYKRSKCPDCLNTGLQIASSSYNCFMCGRLWAVAKTCTTLRPRRMCVK